MDYNQLKNSVRSIEMSEDMKNRMISNATLKSNSGKARPAAVWKKPLVAVLAVVVCLMASIPALAAAATVEPIYALMYQLSPALAQYFKPVQKIDDDNGIRMEVVSAYIHDNTANIYITMQDLIGTRLDETTDLFDSYSIHLPFDSISHCERLGYDAETKTATFLITIEQMDNQNIVGDKITFSVRQLLSQKTEYEGIEIPYDLTTVTQAAETQKVETTGGGGPDYDIGVESGFITTLIPGEPNADFPVNGINLTGIAFVDGKLHIQMETKDRRQNDNHGYFYLTDPVGNQILCNANYYFYGNDQRVDYMESVFFITPEKLAECNLYGNFWISGQLTEGDWRVTFPLEQEI